MFAVSVPLAIAAPVIVRPLFTVVVPEEAPRESVVAALPIERLVTPELNIVPVAVVVVISALDAPFTARSPVTTVLLLIVVVPVDAPNETAVAAPPILRVVAFALNMLAVAFVVVISPPLTAMLPPYVVRPVPRNVNVGFVVVFPNETFSEPSVVLMLR